MYEGWTVALVASIIALAASVAFFSEVITGGSVAPARDLALAIGCGLIAVLCWALIYHLFIRERRQERASKASDAGGDQILTAFRAPIREGLAMVGFGVLVLALSWGDRDDLGASTLSFGLLVAVAASLIAGLLLALWFFALVKDVELSPPPGIPVARPPSAMSARVVYYLGAGLAFLLLTDGLEEAQTWFAIFGGISVGGGAGLVVWGGLIKWWERRHSMGLLRGFPSGDVYAEEPTALGRRPQPASLSASQESQEARVVDREAEEVAREFHMDMPGLGLMVGGRVTPRRWLTAMNPASGAPLVAIFFGLGWIGLVVTGFATGPIWLGGLLLALGVLALLMQPKRNWSRPRRWRPTVPQRRWIVPTLSRRPKHTEEQRRYAEVMGEEALQRQIVRKKR